MQVLSSPAARRASTVLALLTFAVAGSAAAPSPTLTPTGAIAGHVRDAAGGALAGARLVAVGTSLSAVTDAQGAYRLSPVPSGLRTVRVSHTGFATVEDTVHVVAGGTSRLDITLSPAGIPPQNAATSPPAAQAQELRAEGTTRRADPIMDAWAMGAPHAKAAAPGIAEPWRWQREPGNTESYNAIDENRFLAAVRNPLSTFSIDVDAASYSNVRRFLQQGMLPPADAVRLEELVNYFPYRYADRSGPHPFAVATDVGPCPWSPGHRLVRIGLQARRMETAKLPPSNLVFLIDVSGSMSTPDKLPLVKQAFRALVQELRPVDRVAIVVYAGAAGLVLPPTSGTAKETILAALDRLEAGGSTAGGAGLRLAYDVAREHFDPEGNNRVILATDGDFNVGVSSDAEMIRLIEQRRGEGTFLTVLGFGTGNLKDSKMEQIADHGNGHYAYIDSFREARKVFVQEFGGTLYTLARDVKIQVEFNPARVQSYRLLGYENRRLAAEDFADDRKDAGELGAGHAVTALYEVVPAGAEPVSEDDSLLYQTSTVRPSARRSAELLTVRVRYKDPQGSRSRLLANPVVDRGDRVGSEELRFASAVAEFAMLLRGSEHRGSASYAQALELARGARGSDEQGYRAEFIGLVETARTLSGATGNPEEALRPR